MIIDKFLKSEIKKKCNGTLKIWVIMICNKTLNQILVLNNP